MNEEELYSNIIKWQQYHDEDAFKILLEQNIGLIKKATHLYHFVEYDDVMSTAYEGFVSALNHIDVSKPKYNFYNYVYRCIRQKLYSEFIDRKYSVKAVTNLDEMCDDKRNGYDIIPQKHNEIDELINKLGLDELLSILLETLTTEEKDIVIRHYGLFNHNSETITKIAESKSYNNQRTSFLCNRAKNKLRQSKELSLFR